MLFNSLHFLIFFPIVIGLYFSLPYRYRWGFLLAASYYFYACWEVSYLLLIIFSTIVDYWAALQMGKKDSRKKRRPFLVLSLGANLGLLLFFKYFNFFNDSLRFVFQEFNLFYDVPALDLLLPVGISFYTFQTLAYTIDVYRGIQHPEKHIGKFALYVSFFPQLVAGPIERSTRMLPQYRKNYDFDYDRVVDGLKQMAWGFFKKLVIADRLDVYVSEVYSHPDITFGWPVIIAAYMFTIQVYCDFSAYSDIGIGAARVMGYDLMRNFRQPFFGKSMAEFWQRWHISLTTWFKDYLYIPLGGNRVSKKRWISNLFIVFLVSGLWHGAAWTFVIFGFLHGMYLSIGALTMTFRNKLWQQLIDRTHPKLAILRDGVKLFGTFHLFMVSLFIFRAPSLDVTITLLKNALIFRPNTDLIIGFTELDMLIAILATCFLFYGDWVEECKGSMRKALTERSTAVRWVFYFAMGLTIVLTGHFSEREFIYFQF